MTMLEFQELLVRRITELQGCKATELVSDEEVVKALMVNDDISLLDALDAIVTTNRIVEIEYVLPELDFRVKSFYLPANTQVRVCAG
jgi:hypothetical protein